MDSRARARFAAATGLLFALAIAATGIISEVKEFDRAGDLVLQASNEVFGTTTLLTGFAAVFFFAFGSTLAARIRQLEGGSGRLAAAVNASSAIIAGTLALSVGIAYAARSTGSADLAALLTGLLDGPALFFPAAVFLGAGSTVALRTPSIPSYSMWSARLIFPLALAYLAFGGLQLFKNYAWLNETGYISFAVTVAIVSLIGMNRWGEMDDTTPAQRRSAPAPAAAPAAAAPAKRKPAKRKPARKR
ncbi:MAG TPA: hypothetical protein VFA34_05850 [Actinomycetota bacterium]|jgi:hypothetical protein|nr:hypothetical protein [Actinomycetota bacterium]